MSTWLGRLGGVARLTLRQEFAATLPLSVVKAALTATFCGFIGRKALGLSDTLLGVLIGSYFLGLVLTGPLVGYFQEQRKIARLSQALVGTGVVLVTVGLLPSGWRWAGWVFVVQMFLAQIGYSLAFPLRAAIWRANYPPEHRGQINVVIGLCFSLGTSAVVLAFTSAMDAWGVGYQAVYFVSGVCSFVAAWAFGRIRIRRERASLRAMAAETVQRAVAGERQAPKLLAGLAVLWQDRRYGQYMGWQMLNGMSVLMVETVLVVVLADVLGANWLGGGSALAAVPLAVTAVSALVWARLYDRTDVYAIRASTALTQAASRIVLMAGIYWGSLWVVLLSRVLMGVGMGGGQLVWRLGHMAFAPEREDSLYMGAHLSLTGLRGMIAPLAGLGLYRLDCMGPHGVWMIGISVLMQVVAAWGFLRMRNADGGRAMRTNGRV